VKQIQIIINVIKIFDKTICIQLLEYKIRITCIGFYNLKREATT